MDSDLFFNLCMVFLLFVNVYLSYRLVKVKDAHISFLTGHIERQHKHITKLMRERLDRHVSETDDK